MITKSDWYLHRLAITRCWSVMPAQLHKINSSHRHHLHTQKTRSVMLEVVRSVAMAPPHSYNSKSCQWNNHSHHISSSNNNSSTCNLRRCNMTITTTTTTTVMVRQTAAVVAWQPINSIHRSWKYHTAPKLTDRLLLVVLPHPETVAQMLLFYRFWVSRFDLLLLLIHLVVFRLDLVWFISCVEWKLIHWCWFPNATERTDFCIYKVYMYILGQKSWNQDDRVSHSIWTGDQNKDR